MVHTLSNSIEASYIRILPLTWNKNICLRFMLLGCQTGMLNNDGEVRILPGKEEHACQAFIMAPKKSDSL